MLFAALTLTSCSSKKEIEIRYIDKPYRVSVPVKCIVPEANCSFNRETDTEVINALIECIVNMKKNDEICK